jgi:hypothetical protein
MPHKTHAETACTPGLQAPVCAPPEAPPGVRLTPTRAGLIPATSARMAPDVAGLSVGPSTVYEGSGSPGGIGKLRRIFGLPSQETLRFFWQSPSSHTRSGHGR